MSEKKTILLCMGSSCFMRGNSKNLPKIQQFLKDHKLTESILLKGCRCGNCCGQGPNLWWEGKCVSNLTEENLNHFLLSLLDKKEQ